MLTNMQEQEFKMTVLTFPLVLRENLILNNGLPTSGSEFSVIPTMMKDILHVGVGHDMIMMHGGKK